MNPLRGRQMRFYVQSDTGEKKGEKQKAQTGNVSVPTHFDLVFSCIC